MGGTGQSPAPRMRPPAQEVTVEGRLKNHWLIMTFIEKNMPQLHTYIKGAGPVRMLGLRCSEHHDRLCFGVTIRSLSSPQTS